MKHLNHLLLLMTFTNVLIGQDLKPKIYPNDPFKLQEFTLKNGLTVLISEYHNSPRFYSMIATKAGSKNDPADATGLAHYLEHMLFKGSDKLGSKDYKKEAPLIQEISDMYEVYRKTTGDAQRKAIYHKIDSLSGVAAKFAIANEYDKATAALGCKGSNAFTSFEQTVYVNDVPSNELLPWLTLEGERFRKLVLRLFHTELEAVYEEKNRGLDNDERKVFESFFEQMFKNHPYGTQTTIGTIPHLKNPSMKEIMAYFQKYYVPNNMAIILSGDLNAAEAVKLIEEKFGYMQPKSVPTFTFLAESEITSPRIAHVYGPESESMMMGYRFPGISSPETDLLKMMVMILTNGQAGLFDLNLNQKQKVQNTEAFDFYMKDYSCMLINAKPKSGQSLDEVLQLIKTQLSNLKTGNFPDWLMEASIDNFELQLTKQLENNDSRANEIMNAFTSEETWEHHIGIINRLRKITKKQVTDFASQNLNDNYVLVQKHIGEDTSTVKVVKPAITPVDVNREDQSPFLSNLLKIKTSPIEPVFINFDKDLQKKELKNGLGIYSSKNNENATFELNYLYEMGSNNDMILPVALEYLKFAGTDKYPPEKIKEEFFKLACSFEIVSNEYRTSLMVNGLDKNFEKALGLFEHLLSNVKGSPEIWNDLVNTILKNREDAKLNKREILQNGLTNYAKFGPQNPFTHKLSSTTLKELSPEKVAGVIRDLPHTTHSLLYYGPQSTENLYKSLSSYSRFKGLTPAAIEENKTGDIHPPAITPPEIITEQNTGSQVLIVDYDMKQVEIEWIGKGAPFNVDMLPPTRLYNEYMGGGMSSILFQELRESKALAYTVSGRYLPPTRKTQSFYLLTYIGSQSDKLGEAVKSMTNLIQEIPPSDLTFSASKESLLSGIRNERITRSQLLLTYMQIKLLGLTTDPRKEVFEKVQTMDFATLRKFQEKFIKTLPFTLLVLGKKDLLDLNTLQTYGKLTFLNTSQVFGY